MQYVTSSTSSSSDLFMKVYFFFDMSYITIYCPAKYTNDSSLNKNDEAL